MIDINTLDERGLCQLFDHTYLKAYAVREDFVRLCTEAKENHFRMVAINSYPVALCKELLQGSNVHVGAAISFPLGQMSIEGKCAETKIAIRDGADEIDYVVNIGKVKEHDYDYIAEEMKQIVKICHDSNVLIKVIFENCYLTDDEKRTAAEIALKVRPDFIKTSTGFGTAGATAEDIALMRRECDADVRIKAAGGIRSQEAAQQMLDNGAVRIGASKL